MTHVKKAPALDAILWGYRYFFYRAYRFQLKRWNGSESLAVKASAGALCLIIFSNLFSLFMIVYLGIAKYLPSLSAKFIGYSCGISGLLVYEVLIYVFMRNEKYKAIVREFSEEASDIRRKRGFWFYLYVAGSAIIFVILIFTI